MEFSRKKITDEAIYAEEKKLAAEISAITEEYAGKFEELGYVLEKEFIRDNDSVGLTPEEREEVRKTDVEEAAGAYEMGYSSIAKITVKRAKTVEDLAAEAEVEEPEEELSEEERELRENERTLEKAKREQARSVAFTTMLLVRVYKTFWKETVSISESAEEIRADMEEFYSVLFEKAQNAEAECEEPAETEAE
ncbi:MAG: hypothetical protein IJX55_02605 [Clostridia bacterium]|nr:hypothetical protein [Clostridia bacterium]